MTQPTEERIAELRQKARALRDAIETRFVDLDGALLLKQDRDHGLHYDGSLLHPPLPQLWG